jgi:curli biogenesis system outer membrane secretion channel CsgG
VDFQAQPGGWTLAPTKLGSIVSELMLNELSGTGEFHVYDGQWLSSAFNGQPNPDARALLKAARDAGVQYLVSGSIARLSNEHRKRTIGGGALLLHRPVLDAYRSDRNDVAVSILVRVADVETGEIRMTAIGDGLGRRTNRGVGGLALARLPVLAGLAVQSLSSRDAQLYEATTQAVHAASTALITNAPARLLAR